MKRGVPVLLLLAASLVSACARQSYLLYPAPGENLAETATALQNSITRAEENGCRIENVAVGAGQGVGVGLGIGLGYGVGVGINVTPDCPECVGRKDLNKVVEQSKEVRDTKVERASLFAPIALASCPQSVHLSPDGTRR